MGLRSFAAFVLIALACTLARGVRADEQGDLEKARNAYLAKQYEEADARFRTILDPKTGTLRDPSLVSEARMYWGATLLAMHRSEEARALFRRLLLGQRDYEPDPLRVPPDVVNFFIDTRTQMREELKQADMEAARREEARRSQAAAEKARQEAWLAKLRVMAESEVVTERHSRWVAMVPFGVGQFQNGQDGLGWFFLTTESAFLAAVAATWPIYAVQRGEAADLIKQGDNTGAEQWIQRAQKTLVVNWAANGAFVLTALVGVVQAQLSYVPYRTEVRKRPLPVEGLRPTLAPLVAAREGGSAFTGGMLGIEGRF